MENKETQDRPGLHISALHRAQLGPLVRDTWIRWTEGQPNAKPSPTFSWEELDQNRKEFYQYVGDAVADRILTIVDDYEDFPRHLVPKARTQQLYNRCQEQAEVIKTMNQTIGELMNQVTKYFKTSLAVCDTQLAISNADDDTRATAITKHIGALSDLRQVALTKQAVDMGPYKAVDFTRLASDYITLREALYYCKDTLTKMCNREGLEPNGEIFQVIEKALSKYPTCDWGPCTKVPLDKDVIAGLGRMIPIEVTHISITPHVKELVAMLEPNTKIEALVYERGKAVITTISAKLAALTQAVGEVIHNNPAQCAPGESPYEPIYKLNRLYYLLTTPMAPTFEAGDPVGYTTLKFKTLQVAAQGVITAYGATVEELRASKLANSQTVERLAHSVIELDDTLKRIKLPSEVERGPKDDKRKEPTGL